MDCTEADFPLESKTSDDKPNDGSCVKKRSVKSYAKKVFQESTIGVVASIASSNSQARRLFKSLVFFMCISGFSYQCITFLLHVLDYPTTVNVDIHKPEIYNVPAISFCNNNQIKRSLFCENYETRCFQPNEKFCSKFYSYCGKNGTLVPTKDAYNFESFLTFKEIFRMESNHSEDYILNITDEEEIEMEPSGPYLRYKNPDSGVILCYSLNSVFDKAEKPKQIRRKKDLFAIKRAPIMKMKFYIREDEMFIPGTRPGVFLSIHSPYEAVNPADKGMFLKPGRNYRIFVSMVEEVLLENPFSTDCINYEELWENNNRTGPRIQEMCYQKCLKDLLWKCYQCVHPIILYPHNSKLCDPDLDEDSAECDEEDINDYYNCEKLCKDDCNVTNYDYQLMELYEVDYVEDENLDHYGRIMNVEIFVEAREVVTLRHSPKYLTVEVFSSIGGFIGCWLGISLMDIIDALASIFSITRYSIKKKNTPEEL